MLKSRQSSQVFATKNVQGQAYHGQSLSGNYVNKVLKVILILI